MVALCHLSRDGGEGEEETGNVVLETHPAAQVSCHVIITWSSYDYVCVTRLSCDYCMLLFDLREVEKQWLFEL